MGAATHPPLDSLAQVRLASEAPLRVGQLTIDPPTRQVQNCERSETLEPRVMQVLVVLARACGRVVSRDELIDCCWEGRAVGEDAIHRVLGKLRHLASGLGQDSFAIETIRGVGYRLREGLSSDDRQQRLAVAARSLSRR